MPDEFTPNAAYTKPAELTKEDYHTALDNIDANSLLRGPVSDRPSDPSGSAVWLDTDSGELSYYDTSAAQWTSTSAVADVRWFGAREGQESGSAIQDAINAVGSGTLIIPNGEWITGQELTTSEADGLTIVFHGSLLLDDGGDGSINAPLLISSNDVTLINPTINGDRFGNTDNGNPGTQATLWLGTSCSGCTILGGRLEYAIDSGLISDGARNVTIHGLTIDSPGEHAVYAVETENIKINGSTFRYPGQLIRSDGLKFRTCEDVSVTDATVWYTGNEPEATLGTRIEDGSTHVNVDVTVENADFGCRVSGTDSNGALNDNITIELTALNCNNATTGMTDMGDVRLERVYCKNSSFRTRGIPSMGAVTVINGSMWADQGRTQIDHLRFDDNDFRNVEVENGGNLIVNGGYISAGPNATTAVDVNNDTGDERITLKNAHALGADTYSVTLRTSSNALVDCFLPQGVNDIPGNNDIVRS